MNFAAMPLINSLERRASAASHSRAEQKQRGRIPFSDDLPPTGEEARIQRAETVMPLVWAGLGLMLVLLYSVALGVR